MIELYNGDCLEVMDGLIEQGVIVDAIICDPPYGTTACKWDTIIPFNAYKEVQTGKNGKLKVMYEDEYVLFQASNSYESVHYWRDEFKETCNKGMWERLNKLIKPNGAIVLFGSEPFSSALRMSNIKNYKYDLIWNKVIHSNPLIAKKQPLSAHECISLFYSKQPTYNPQMEVGEAIKRGKETIGKSETKGDTKIFRGKHSTKERYPKKIITISNANKSNIVHPTQKPVALMEYLIKTYTNENEIALDFTMGSCTTGVACKKLNRNFIGIELDKTIFGTANNRINTTEVNNEDKRHI